MKIKDGFMLREVAEQWVVIPLGERVVEFNGLISLNESGAFLWRLLQQEASEEDLVQALLAEYDIDEDAARADVREFIRDISQRSLLA